MGNATGLQNVNLKKNMKHIWNNMRKFPVQKMDNLSIWFKRN